MVFLKSILHIKFNILIILFLISIVKLIRLGVVPHDHVWEDFQMYQIIDNFNNYTVDLFSVKLIPIAGPILQYLFQYIYDIPFAHLLIGFSSQFLVCCLLFLITFKYSQNELISIICCCSMMFIIPSFIDSNPNVWNFENIPASSRELFLSFREISKLICLLSILFYLEKQKLLSVLLLSINFFNHPTNTINVFILILSSDIFISLSSNKKSMKNFYYYSIFLIPVLIRIVMFKTADFNSEQISFKEHWGNAVMNEPDDWSTLFAATSQVYSITRLKYGALLIISIFILFIGKREDNSRKIVIGKLFLIIIPTFTTLLALYEKYFFSYFPDFLNDFIMVLQPKRSWGIIPIIGLPITIKFLYDILKLELMFKRLIIKERYFQYLLVFLFSIPSTVHGIKKGHLDQISQLLNLNKQRPYYFYNITKKNPYFYGQDKSALNEEELIEISSYHDVCNYINKNTSETSSFIYSPVLKDFRYLSGRQGFCGEKNDGNYAGLNRSFASRYYEQIFILTGLSYDQLEEPMYQGGENYRLLNQGFLSLEEDKIIEIAAKYNGYEYFITEIGHKHKLNFEVEYANSNYLIYKINK